MLEFIDAVERSLAMPLLGRPDLGVMGNAIRAAAGSEFSQDLFERFWLGMGDLELTSARFANIVESSMASGVVTSTSMGPFGLIPNATAKIVSFYQSDQYKRALGSATIYYEGPYPIGFYDRYDFDDKEWGTVRTYPNETITRLVNMFAPSSAKSYDIKYQQ